ncbi:hypothetical protein [Dyadobacter crusticola]|uniref:hypothetical protein n=1 Tax=Dyadobacter crusticola TaxID=292407 RepID=UPI0004E1C757|nr:hypothetical protein [Dyadobacter crusticola]
MTNWETFILVVIALGGSAGPLLAVVIIGARQSNEIYKVLKEPRAYKTTISYFFLTTDIFFAYLFTLMAGFTTKTLFNLDVYPSNGDWRAYLMLSLLVLTMLFFAAWIQILYINHWKHSKKLIITFEPATKTVWVEKDEQEYVLREDTIESVECYSNQGSKFLFQYYKFNLTGNASFYISGQAKGVPAIMEYFKKIPVKLYRRRYPLMP